MEDFHLQFDSLLAPEFQELLLAMLFRDRDLLVRARGIVKPNYFTAGVYRAVAQAVFVVYDATRELPDPDTVAVLASKQAESLPERQAFSDAARRYASIEVPPGSRPILVRELIEFVQRARAAVAVGLAYQDIRNFDVDTVVRELTAIQRLPALYNETGLDFERDWERIIEDDSAPRYLTGIHGMDRAMRDGARPGDLVSIMAPWKRGKTLVLENLGHGLYLMGNHVAHYSLEIYSEDTLRHYWAIMTGQATKGLARGLHNAEIIRILEGLSVYASGSLTVVEMASGSPLGAIEAHLEMLMGLKRGKVIPIIDYAALVGGEEGEEWQVLPAIMQGMRRLARRLGVPVFTAQQTNVGGASASELGAQHQGMSTRAAAEVDFTFGVNQSEIDMLANRLRLTSFISRHEAPTNVYFSVEPSCRRLNEVTQEDYKALAANLEMPAKPAKKSNVVKDLYSATA